MSNVDQIAKIVNDLLEVSIEDFENSENFQSPPNSIKFNGKRDYAFRPADIVGPNYSFWYSRDTLEKSDYITGVKKTGVSFRVADIIKDSAGTPPIYIIQYKDIYPRQIADHASDEELETFYQHFPDFKGAMTAFLRTDHTDDSRNQVARQIVAKYGTIDLSINGGRDDNDNNIEVILDIIRDA